jgi:PhnB protein
VQKKLLRGGRRPERHHTVNPLLIVSDIPRLVGFLAQTFDAVEVQRMALPDGKIVQAEVTIDDSLVMITAPKRDAAPMPCSLGIYTNDVDETYQRALAGGARSLQEPADQFYGHRVARIEDPAGNQWTIHTVIEDLSAQDLYRRSAQLARPANKKSN